MHITFYTFPSWQRHSTPCKWLTKKTTLVRQPKSYRDLTSICWQLCEHFCLWWTSFLWSSEKVFGEAEQCVNIVNLFFIWPLERNGNGTLQVQIQIKFWRTLKGISLTLLCVVDTIFFFMHRKTRTCRGKGMLRNMIFIVCSCCVCCIYCSKSLEARMSENLKKLPLYQHDYVRAPCGADKREIEKLCLRCCQREVCT